MFAVKTKMREITHVNHVFIISTAGVHQNHNGYWKHGAHCLWETFCRIHSYVCNFKRFEIQQ